MRRGLACRTKTYKLKAVFECRGECRPTAKTLVSKTSYPGSNPGTPAGIAVCIAYVCSAKIISPHSACDSLIPRMSLQITYNFCKKELNAPGALYFGVPKDGVATKKHICADCSAVFDSMFSGKDRISLAELQRVHIQAGIIENAEDIEGSDKLYKLTVNFGSETRTIVSGIKPWYEKDFLIGKTVIFTTNLAARTLKGIESNGMILAAKEGEKPVLVAPIEAVTPGAPLL